MSASEQEGPAPGGRPTLYKPEYAEQAAKLCDLGATNADIAKFFNVKERTIDRWLSKHPEFSRAIKTGREVADTRVERSLYQRAIGFEHEAVKIFMPANAKDPVYAKYREKVHSDVTAAIFWLKNRKSAEWRDRHDTTTTLNAGDGFANLLGKIAGQSVFPGDDNSKG